MSWIKPFSFAAVFALSLTLTSVAADAETTPINTLQSLAPLNAQSLNSYAGGAAVASNSNVDSFVGGNTIGNVGFQGGVSGVNLNGVNGLSTVIANTGNQVSIATSTAISVYLH